MTEGELQELITDCPVIYHMAERGSWESIQQHGLLSTSALLDLYEIRGEARRRIESLRRTDSISITHPHYGSAVLRDQLPLNDAGLARCLKDGLTPADWYRMLNARVFFWLTRERLLRLLRAGSYAEQEHDVLEVDCGSLVEAYRAQITLCPMNSGCTKPFPHPRGLDTFKGIEAYSYDHWRRKGRKRGERVVELSVLHSVPDIARFVRRVTVMQGETIKAVLWEQVVLSNPRDSQV